MVKIIIKLSGYLAMLKLMGIINICSSRHIDLCIPNPLLRINFNVILISFRALQFGDGSKRFLLEVWGKALAR